MIHLRYLNLISSSHHHHPKRRSCSTSFPLSSFHLSSLLFWLAQRSSLLYSLMFKSFVLLNLLFSLLILLNHLSSLSAQLSSHPSCTDVLRALFKVILPWPKLISPLFSQPVRMSLSLANEIYPYAWCCV